MSQPHGKLPACPLSGRYRRGAVVARRRPGRRLGAGGGEQAETGARDPGDGVSGAEEQVVWAERLAPEPRAKQARAASSQDCDCSHASLGRPLVPRSPTVSRPSLLAP